MEFAWDLLGICLGFARLGSARLGSARSCSLELARDDFRDLRRGIFAGIFAGAVRVAGARGQTRSRKVCAKFAKVWANGFVGARGVFVGLALALCWPCVGLVLALRWSCVGLVLALCSPCGVYGGCWQKLRRAAAAGFARRICPPY